MALFQRRKTIYLIAFVLISCGGKHYHDGKYKSNVYDGGTWAGMHTELLTVDGNEMEVAKYTLEGKMAGRYKFKCTQYPDKIEFEERDVTRILQLDGENLVLDEITVYKPINQDDSVEKVESKSLPEQRIDNAQESSTSVTHGMTAKDSAQALYSLTLQRLDALAEESDTLKSQVSDNNSQISSVESEISSILSMKNPSAAEVKRAKTLIAQLNQTIANLEAENARQQDDQ
jgi:hypothetical protein